MNVVRGLVLGVCLLAALVPQAGAAEATEDAEGKAIGSLLAPAADRARVEPDDERLVALLADPGHDPWLLVEHLLAQDRQDLAIRLARRTDEQTVALLVPYAEAPDAVAGAVARAAALRAARAALAAGAAGFPKAAASALPFLEKARALPGRVSVFGVSAATLQGELLLPTERRGEGIEAWLAGGEEALRIGWWRAADDLLSRAVEAAFMARSFDLLAQAAEGVRALREIRGTGAPLAAAVQNLGSIAQWRGDLPGALRHLNEAMSLFESLGRASDVAEVRSQRSWLLAEMGDFRAALQDQQFLTQYFAGRPRDTAWAANQAYLGLIRHGLGDEQGAFDALTRALAAYRALGDPMGEAWAQGNLGLTYMMGGRWPEAVEAWRASRVLAEGIGDSVGVATADLDLAYALQHGAEVTLAAAARAEDPTERAALQTTAQMALAEGRTLLEEALSITEGAGLAGQACVANHTLGKILITQGRVAEALRVLEPARAEARRLRAWRVHVSLTVTLARTRLLQEDWFGALREARLASDELGKAFGSLADADLARARSLVSDVYDVGVTAARRANSEEDLIHFLEAGRSAALLRGLGGRAAALRATVPQALVERLAQNTRAKLQAFAAWRASREKGLLSSRVQLKEYEARRIEEQKTLADVQQAQAEAATQLAPSRLVAIDDLQRRLRATARPGLRQVFALFNFQSEEATALLVEERSSRVVSYRTSDLGPLRQAFSTLSAARQGDLDAHALATVKRLLIDPLGIPAGPTRLLVCPDRDLAYIPLSVLLPDDWEVVWEPSATIYDLLAERRLRRGQGVLGLGDPDYRAVPDPDALTTRGGPRLLPLPGTRVEIEAITGLSADRRLLGEEATERGLREALDARGTERPWKSIHLACHGLVDVELPALSCLAITPGEGEDGFLSSGEVLQLPLPTDLAVLSACQTGRGKFVRGEGVMSLTRAFMYSGASRVIVSLWDVEDAATAFLMQEFYRHWNAGRGTAEALRLAQTAVRDHEIEETVRKAGKPPTKRRRRPWSDPKYWAAWVLWGLPD